MPRMPPPTASKPAPKRRELHFYPGQHSVLWVVDGVVKLKAKAWGGEEPDPKVHYNVMKPRPTTPGRYVIHSYAPYRTATWDMSKLVWGTALSLDATGKHVLYENGTGNWKKLEALIPGATPKFIQQQYTALYGASGLYDIDGDGIPDQWVFNDFGPWAVRYYKDPNANHRLDKGEHLSGEMFHTTPGNEAQASGGLKVALGPSHGCIHLDPIERDQLHAAGAFDKGNDLIVHRYDEVLSAP